MRLTSVTALFSKDIRWSVSDTASGGHFLLGLAIWIAIGAAFGLWALKSQFEFLKVYETIMDTSGLKIDEEMLVRIVDDPARFPQETVRISMGKWKLLWKRQQDPSLEELRRRCVFRLKIAILAVTLGLVVPIGLSFV
jgi:hypothetical protein